MSGTMGYFWNVTSYLLSGAGATALLFFIVILLSLPLGFCLTLMVRSKFKPLSVVANSYIYVIRGTPLLLQLLFVYFGLPYIPMIGKYFIFERFTAAIIGFILNYAAYFAEIFRGGLLSIDKGQYEAAKVLGFGKFKTQILIILPQMFRVALPSVANEAVTLVKDTALLYAVSVPEILHHAQSVVSRDANVLALLIAAVIYLILNLILTVFFKWLERKANFD
jgi:amine acid ABC transporter, permease protein, 3-TM region, His/Glu/Gln/Arg/opine family